MRRTLNEIGHDVVYVEDQLGVELTALSSVELKMISRICAELAELPTSTRDGLFDSLFDKVNHEEFADETLFDDDQGQS